MTQVPSGTTGSAVPDGTQILRGARDPRVNALAIITGDQPRPSFPQQDVDGVRVEASPPRWDLEALHPGVETFGLRRYRFPMFTRWRCMIAGTIGVVAVLFLMLWLKGRPDPRIEALLSPTLPDAAIEDEVIQAELPSLDDRAIRRIAAELDWGEGAIRRAESWIWQNVPSARQWMLSVLSRKEDRRPQALRVLGLLGPRARIVEPGVLRIGPKGYSDPAAMWWFAWSRIHPPDAAYISNLTRTLAVSSESSRIQMASRHAGAGTIPDRRTGCQAAG